MLALVFIPLIRRGLIERDTPWLILPILFIGLLCLVAKMLVMFRTAAKIRSGLKNHTIQTVRATIDKTSGLTFHHTDTTKKAYAHYTLQNKEYAGEMICAVNRKLFEGNAYTLYVNKINSEYFALSEKQIKDAFLTYLTFLVITIIVSISILVIGILYILSSF